MFIRFKKTVGNGRDPKKVRQANNEITMQLAKDFQELKTTKDPKTNLDLFRLFDFMNHRANLLRARIGKHYSANPGVELMKANAFNAILEEKAPAAFKGYQIYKRIKPQSRKI